VEFTGIVKSFDADEGCGTIVRDRDGHLVKVRSAGLALGVDSLSEGDRVAFDVGLGSDWQARNVTRA
jgi:cold shock CspA family protein